MQTNRTAAVLVVLILVATPCRAQDDDEEDGIDEVAAELADTERRLLFARDHVEFLEQRVQRLKEIRGIQSELQKTEVAIEQAEDDDDDRLVGELEDRLDELGGEVDRQWTLLELSDGLWRVHEIRSELDRTDRLFVGTENLLRLQRRRMELSNRLFDVYSDGPESEEGALEERLEVLGTEFELRIEYLELSRELFWAREEDDEELIEEFERELRTLRRELNEFDRGEEEREEKPRRPRANNSKPPGPVTVSQQEMVAAGKLVFADDIVPLLDSGCVDCHSNEEASGDLNLQTLVTQQPLVVNRTHWLNVIAQLKNRSMPPAGEPGPAEAERRRLVAYLSNAIHNFDYTTVRSPGYEPARRLTHEEYNNTVRDLFGIDLRPADSFPGDLTASSGFDNSANSLFIQPVTMERYVGAAEEIIRLALPLNPTTSEHNRIYSEVFVTADGRTSDSAMLSVVEHFARRAFRRRVQADESQALVDHYRGLRNEGHPPEVAVRETLQAILISPSFLIRTEADRDTHEPYRVNDLEFASRLSYFLWASMPDEQLVRSAVDGELDVRKVLDAEITRMLADDRSRTLGSSFASQWLGFNDLGRVRPGPIDNPWCTDTLIESMKDESALFFWSLVQSNAPIEDVLTADYTYLNEELANHYRMKSVRGEKMRRVSLEGTPRGGILGHGSILAITSFPGRTSPVLRGNWILSELLGTPPPPPPPNVSQFDEQLARERLSVQERLELHRRNPNCYACHSQIDPLGFSLSEFDWFGRHRPGKRHVRGRLPESEDFQGLEGLRDALIEYRLDDLVDQVTRKMLSYALGRQLAYYDEATVREIVATVEADDRRLQTLIRAIVHSETFQMKQRQND